MMPTYDYNCDGCGHTFEEWQSFKDDALTKCPSCKKSKLRRLFGGGAAIIFKGSGFYETDYRRKDEAKKNGQPEGEAKPEAKTETKAETPAKTESAPSDGDGGKKDKGKAKKGGD
jgi:putative FmdB family regulatory protein